MTEVENLNIDDTITPDPPAGPREPLAEKDTRIEQLQNMLASLARYVRVNVLVQRDDPYLRTIVEQAEWTADPRREEKQG